MFNSQVLFSPSIIHRGLGKWKTDFIMIALKSLIKNEILLTLVPSFRYISRIVCVASVQVRVFHSAPLIYSYGRVIRQPGSGAAHSASTAGRKTRSIYYKVGPKQPSGASGYVKLNYAQLLYEYTQGNILFYFSGSPNDQIALFKNVLLKSIIFTSLEQLRYGLFRTVYLPLFRLQNQIFYSCEILDFIQGFFFGYLQVQFLFFQVPRSNLNYVPTKIFIVLTACGKAP